MLNQPTSSPMMTMTFGCLPGVAVRVPGGTAADGAGGAVDDCMAAMPPIEGGVSACAGVDAAVRAVSLGVLVQADASATPRHSKHVVLGIMIQLPGSMTFREQAR
jgi:hypothetical protein